ncbi:MAG: hypothetical protein K2X91_01375 [Thermoleophilia bacterium]|jgi:cell shape-determining protein MreD|nr:hypothetical protein [Thermoleophilia bacterium]
MRTADRMARSCAVIVTAPLVGAHASAAVPALVFGASFREFVQMSVSVYLPALCLAIAAAPLAARGLREDGPGRLAWQCALIATMLIAGTELRWMQALDLSFSPTLIWNVVFKSLLRGVPGGIASACAAVLVLRVLSARRAGAPA